MTGSFALWENKTEFQSRTKSGVYSEENYPLVPGECHDFTDGDAPTSHRYPAHQE